MTRPMYNTLREEIESAPADRFWQGGEAWGPPDYRRVLHDVLLGRYPDGLVPIEDVLTEHFPHPSTLQRMVAGEARRRREARRA